MLFAVLETEHAVTQQGDEEGYRLPRQGGVGDGSHRKGALRYVQALEHRESQPRRTGGALVN